MRCGPHHDRVVSDLADRADPRLHFRVLLARNLADWSPTGTGQSLRLLTMKAPAATWKSGLPLLAKSGVDTSRSRGLQ